MATTATLAKRPTTTFTNVRWKIPDDVMQLINDHQKILSLSEKREVSQQYAVLDLLRNKKFPRVMIVHE